MLELAEVCLYLQRENTFANQIDTSVMNEGKHFSSLKLSLEAKDYWSDRCQRVDGCAGPDSADLRPAEANLRRHYCADPLFAAQLRPVDGIENWEFPLLVQIQVLWNQYNPAFKLSKMQIFQNGRKVSHAAFTYLRDNVALGNQI